MRMHQPVCEGGGHVLYLLRVLISLEDITLFIP